MDLKPYKQNQGVYARGVAGIGLAVFIAFSGWRLTQLVGLNNSFELLGMGVPYGAIWGVSFAIIVGMIASVFVFGIQTGWSSLDQVSIKFVDLLIDTQNELKKVAWPGKDELKRYTGVVIACILVLGAFLYVVDMVVSFTMSSFSVLPK